MKQDTNTLRVTNPFAQNLLHDWLSPSTGRQSSSINESKTERDKNKQNSFDMMKYITAMADNSIQTEFQEKFLYGVEMNFWRKGRMKKVMVFIDQNFESLVWFSSQTKAFLFDMSYTTISRFDYELESTSNIKNYIILRYFGEVIPLLFPDAQHKQVDIYHNLFERYIIWCKSKNVYPPYFSKLLKEYTMEEIQQNFAVKKTVADLLKIADERDRKYNEKVLKMLLKAEDKNSQFQHSTILNQNVISQYFKVLHCNKDLLTHFEKYSNQQLQDELMYLKPLMINHQFEKFLKVQQKQSQEFINTIMNQTRQKISFYDFCSYLQSQKGNYATECHQIDENLPLNQYFCYSSHNTYLSGNQLTSDSKIDRYLEDLTGGLKCVQLDVHNDGDRPIITHAVKDKSLCKQIDFEETIIAIAKFAQVHPKHYPIILSIENHATQENRYKMFNIMMKFFNRNLFILSEDLQDCNIGECKTLEELKGRIIVKSDSKLDEIMALFKNRVNIEMREREVDQLELPEEFYSQKLFTENLGFQYKFNQFNRHIRQQKARKEKFENSMPVSLFLPIPQISKISTIFKSQKGIENSRSTSYQCTSLTNKKIQGQKPQKIIDYTKRSWLRSYPKATEISSSNYNPIRMLETGCQIIAMNTQTKDDYAWLMMSYFTSGRILNCLNVGYIEKPKYLRKGNLKVQEKEKRYKIKILNTNEKVKLKFFGTDKDMQKNEKSTEDFIIKDKNEAFFMFYINENMKDCLPVRFIRTGFRVLVARNEMYYDSGVRILIEIRQV